MGRGLDHLCSKCGKRLETSLDIVKKAILVDECKNCDAVRKHLEKVVIDAVKRNEVPGEIHE